MRMQGLLKKVKLLCFLLTIGLTVQAMCEQNDLQFLIQNCNIQEIKKRNQTLTEVEVLQFFQVLGEAKNKVEKELIDGHGDFAENQKLATQCSELSLYLIDQLSHFRDVSIKTVSVVKENGDEQQGKIEKVFSRVIESSSLKATLAMARATGENKSSNELISVNWDIQTKRELGPWGLPISYQFEMERNNSQVTDAAGVTDKTFSSKRIHTLGLVLNENTAVDNVFLKASNLELDGELTRKRTFGFDKDLFSTKNCKLNSGLAYGRQNVTSPEGFENSSSVMEQLNNFECAFESGTKVNISINFDKAPDASNSYYSIQWEEELFELVNVGLLYTYQDIGKRPESFLPIDNPETISLTLSTNPIMGKRFLGWIDRLFHTK